MVPGRALFPLPSLDKELSLWTRMQSPGRSMSGDLRGLRVRPRGEPSCSAGPSSQRGRASSWKAHWPATARYRSCAMPNERVTGPSLSTSRSAIQICRSNECACAWLREAMISLTPIFGGDTFAVWPAPRKRSDLPTRWLCSTTPGPDRYAWRCCKRAGSSGLRARFLRGSSFFLRRADVRCQSAFT